MGAHVDGAAGAVRLGDASWPLELDCASSTATLVVDGSRLVLRPLRWREKTVLARFAGLGEAFLRDQLVRACLAEGEPPRDGPAGEAVLAVALWLNAGEPAGAAPAALPLDGEVLALATLDVCRSLGLAPGDLDDRDAPEVEALFRAAERDAGAARPGAPPADAPVLPGPPHDPWAASEGVRRILVVPDEPASPDVPGDKPPLDDAAAHGHAPETVGLELPAQASPGTTAAAPAPDRTERTDERALRFRVRAARLAAGDRPAESRRAEREPWRPREPDPGHEDAALAADAPAPAMTGPWPEPPARRRNGSTWDGRASQPVAPAPVAAAAAPSLDLDAVLDELTTRLEQAAADLGVDVDG
jgi:hypothetical protein